MNIMAGPGVAVREFPLKTGYADYLLYVDGKVAGIVEAKPDVLSFAPCNQNCVRWRYVVVGLNVLGAALAVGLQATRRLQGILVFHLGAVETVAAAHGPSFYVPGTGRRPGMACLSPWRTSGPRENGQLGD